MHEEKIEELELEKAEIQNEISNIRIELFKQKNKGAPDQKLQPSLLVMNKDKLNQLKLNKWQLKAIIARQIGFKLMNALPDSTNYHQYKAITNCCYSVYWKTDNSKSSKYCGQRLCPVCASIKSGKMIQGYKQPLSELNKQLWFLTLTVQTIDKYGLPKRLTEMQKHFSRITKTNTELNRKYPDRKLYLNGLRKLELIVAKNDKFHAHYHIIMDSKKGAEHLRTKWHEYWKKHNPQKRLTSMAAQDIRPVTNIELGLVELTKYVSKPAQIKSGKNKTGVLVEVTPKHLDWILSCLKNKQTFKPFGKLKRSQKKYVPTGDALIEKPSRLDSKEYIWFIQNWYGIKSKQALGLARPNLTAKEKKELTTKFDNFEENAKSLQATMDKYITKKRNKS